MHSHIVYTTQSSQALEENIAEAKLELKKLVDAGHKLEACTGTQPSSLPDIGYIALEDRYLALKVLSQLMHRLLLGY